MWFLLYAAEQWQGRAISVCLRRFPEGNGPLFDAQEAGWGGVQALFPEGLVGDLNEVQV